MPGFRHDEPPDWVAVERAKRGFPVGRSLFPSEQTLLVRWGRENSVPNTELAERVGVSEETIIRWNRKAGLPRMVNKYQAHEDAPVG